jgi:hypothetical protein
MRTIIAAGAGAGLMYLCDPDHGRRRRADLRDRALHFSRVGYRASRKQVRNALNHARGVLAETERELGYEWPADDVLVERVRADIGHVINRPHRVSVHVDAGCIVLSGSVLPEEKEKLLARVRKVPGVLGVDDHLDADCPVDGEPTPSATTV